jgi:hypothetical protein
MCCMRFDPRNFQAITHPQVTKEGAGNTPNKGQSITVHCTGKLADGKKFWRFYLFNLFSLKENWHSPKIWKLKTHHDLIFALLISSTKDPGQEPFTFNVGVGGVIAGDESRLLCSLSGWDVGCMTMRRGECATLTCRGDKVLLF